MKRFTGLDWLKFAAAFGIVGCHLGLSPRTAGADVLMRLTDVNVGVFSAISGFFLMMGLEKNLPLSVDLVKKAVRLLPVYAVWSAVYLLFGTVGGGHVERLKDVGFLLNAVFTGGAFCHLWYLVALFYFSAAVLVVRRVCPGLLSLPALAVGSLACLAFSTVGDYTYWWCYYFARLAAFACLGMLLYRVRASLARVPGPVWIVAAVVGVGFRLAVGGPVHKFCLDYAAALPVLACCATVSFPREAAARRLVDLSLGVYLLHPLIATVVARVVPRIVPSPYGPGILLLDWAVVSCLAVAGVLVLKRIPFVRRFA